MYNSTERQGYSSATFQAYEKTREPTRPVTEQIVRQILKSTFEKSEWVLEIGSGIGELAGLLPEQDRIRTMQSDILPDLVAKIPFETPKLIASTHSLPFKNNSVPAIASYSVLNAIVNIEEAINEIERVLKPAGFFTSFLDLQTIPEFVMTRFPDDILIPATMLVPKTNITVTDRLYMQVNSNTLKRGLHLHEEELENDILKFLNDYMANPIPQWHAYQANSDEAARLAHSQRIVQAISSLGIEAVFIDALEYFTIHLEKYARNNGFNIKQSEMISGSGVIDRTEIKNPDRRNSYHTAMGAHWKTTDQNLEPDKIRLESTLFVFVAQKSLSTR